MQPTQPQKISTRTKVALVLMIGPTVLLILALVFSAAFNWALSDNSSPLPAGCTQSTESDVTDSNGITRVADEDCSNELFGETRPASTVVNVITYIMGVIGFITWLPGLITGIILLATKPRLAK